MLRGAVVKLGIGHWLQGTDGGSIDYQHTPVMTNWRRAVLLIAVGTTCRPDGWGAGIHLVP
jgi:hypothetical protein